MKGEKSPLVFYLHEKISRKLRGFPVCVQGHVRGSTPVPLSPPSGAWFLPKEVRYVFEKEGERDLGHSGGHRTS